MEPVRIGFIGCGVIGRLHARTIVQTPSVTFVAVADLIEERAREFAETYGVPKRYREGLDLLDDPDIEGVILALPACGRKALALKAFRNHKHIIDEKPVAMNAADVEDMIAARGSLVAVCGHDRMRYRKAMDRVTEFVASGALGELRVLNSRQITAPSGPPQNPPPTWRLRRAENGGGILMNWGCYDLAYLLGLTGWKLKPKTVLGRTWTVSPAYSSYIAPNSDAETHINALILCEGGTVINYERAEYAAARPEAMWQITGSKGSLHLNLVAEQAPTAIYDSATPEGGTISRELFVPEEEPLTGMAIQLDDFAHAIREQRKPRTGLEEALIVQKITDAIYESSRRGAAVEI